MSTYTDTRTPAQRAAVRSLAGRLAYLRSMAGDDFSWVAPNGKPIGHEPSRYSKTRNESAREGYRILMWERQQDTCGMFAREGFCDGGCNGKVTGICASCGECMDRESFHIAHLVGNGGSKGKVGGHVDFNTFGCCAFCNLLDAEDNGEIVPPKELARPDLLDVMPTRAAMLAADKANRDATTARKARLRAERARRSASWVD